jgi:hypothetical protein
MEASRIILRRMKMKPEMNLTLGELIMSACQARATDRAANLARLVLRMRLAVFQEPAYCLIHSTKGRQI